MQKQVMLQSTKIDDLVNQLAHMRGRSAPKAAVDGAPSLDAALGSTEVESAKSLALQPSSAAPFFRKKGTPALH